MNPYAILEKHFSGNRESLEIVYEHSRMVANKALQIAQRLDEHVDLRFIEEAALLHDIGVARIHAPKIGCYGKVPYICHGIIGRDILEAEGLLPHALVCERHIGVGITVDDIVRNNLLLPERDMTPVSLEEKIVCFADLFFSKRPGLLHNEKTVAQIRGNLVKHGNQKVSIFEKWLLEFNR